MFAPVDVEPAYKVVCERIENEILSGRLRPGSQLPTETALASQFGLTRHTVREGIRILEQGGLVRREAGRRLFVVLPHYSDLAPRVSRALLMQKVSFRELWEVSLDLEVRAATSAAEHIRSEQLAALELNLHDMTVELDANRSIIELDIKFHTMIAKAANNRVLLLAREPVSLLFFPALDTLFTHPRTRLNAPRRLLDAHRLIVAGLKARDVAIAKGWMRRHMEDFRRGYERCGLNLDEPVSQ